MLEIDGSVGKSFGILLAVHQKDKDAVFEILKNMIDVLINPLPKKKPELFSHMKFSRIKSQNLALMLQKGLEEDSDLDFIREDRRYNRVKKQLEKLAAVPASFYSKNQKKGGQFIKNYARS